MLKFPTEHCVETRYDGKAYRLKICGQKFAVIASIGGGWDHVSVSHERRCPTWREMCKIKDMFFDEEDTVLQIHPPKSTYVNDHPRCLHLWRNQNAEIELPPVEFI